MSILIHNCTALLSEGVEEAVSIAIEGRRIARIGPKSAFDPGDFETVIEGPYLALPGLINAHTHLAMVLFRGYADDLPLERWLREEIWPAEAHLTAEQVYWASLLGCAELIRGGTTAFADMYFFMDEVARAVQTSGLRALLAYGVIAPRFDERARRELEISEAFVKAWHGEAGGRIRVALGPHAPYTCAEEVWTRAVELCRTHNLRLHTHLCETRREVEDSLKRTGKRPPRYLEELGVFEVPVLAAHGVHLDEEDIAILARHDISLVHNPASNLKLGSGIAPLPRLLEAGVNVALGTDGAASNNNLSLFEELKLAATLHKGLTQDPEAVPAQTALRLATLNGAQALGLIDDVGALAPGRAADLILLDLEGVHLQPLYDAHSTVVYAAQAADVATTIVDGQILMRDRSILTFDEAEVKNRVREYARGYRRFHVHGAEQGGQSPID